MGLGTRTGTTAVEGGCGANVTACETPTLAIFMMLTTLMTSSSSTTEGRETLGLDFGLAALSLSLL